MCASTRETHGDAPAQVAAARRTADGVEFYDFDLALPATSCDDTLAAACLPTLVVLLSACVRDSQLHVLRIDASPDEWCALQGEGGEQGVGGLQPVR